VFILSLSMTVLASRMGNVGEGRAALADFLRTRRARLSPEGVGLPGGGRRRTPGLRREEVALLAHIGTSWYVALEQGRDVHPSAAVLDGISTALRLTEAERLHLFVLARLPVAPAPADAPAETVGAALRSALHRLNPHPAYVMGRRWDLLAWNAAAEAVFAFSEIAPPHGRNFLWRCFTWPALRAHPQWASMAKGLVAQFRLDSAHHPDDPAFAQLITDLQGVSGEFREWWSRHDVRTVPDGPKRLVHPTFGSLEFEHVTLHVPGAPDQKLVLYTCTPEAAAVLSAALSGW